MRRVIVCCVVFFSVVSGCECSGVAEGEGEGGDEGEGEGGDEGEGEGEGCATDDDCADADACTADRCAGGACVHGAALDGTACGDDPCTGGSACVAGACTAGVAVDLDADDDGAFTAVCGGNDCDDNDALVGPLFDEGGPGTCDDGKDNDCDGAADALEVSCGGTEVCDAGWCWENPRPHGLQLSAVWASSPNDVWLGGPQGGLIHYDGAGFAIDDVVVQGFPARVGHMWGSSPTDIWATAGGGVLHHDGLSWQLDPRLLGAVADVWGFAADDVFAVGSGFVHHFDGVAWATTDLSALGVSQLTAVHGSAPDDVWAVGGANQVVHFDGDEWRVVRLTPGQFTVLLGVVSFGADDVWAAGDFGAMWHFDGATFTSVPAPPNRRFAGIWGAAPDDIWAVGDVGTIAHYNGSEWGVAATLPIAGALVGLRGFGAADLWAVGQGGAIAHYDGDAWTRPNAGPDALDANLTDVVVVGAGADRAVYAVGTGTGGGGVVGRRDGDGNWHRETGTAVGGTLVALAASAPDDVWAVGTGPSAHFDGTSWTEAPALGAGSPFFNATDACAVGRADLYAVGTNLVDRDILLQHFEDGVWRGEAAFDTADSIRSDRVFCLAGDDVWAGGFDALFHKGGDAVWRRTGTTQITASAIVAVTAFPSAGAGEVQSDVRVLVGGDRFDSAPTVVRYDGRDWVSDPLPGNFTDRVTVFDLAGSGPNDLWITSDAGLFHSDGTGFAPTSLGTAQTLSDLAWVQANAPDDVFFTQEDLTTFHFDGATLRQISDENASVSGDVGRPYFSSATDGWAASTTFGSTMFHFDGTTWTPDFGFPISPTGRVFGFAADDVWAAGEDLTLAHFDGSAWTVVDLGDGSFTDEDIVDVWGAASDDVWAVADAGFTGAGGKVFHDTGSGFVAVEAAVVDAERSVVRGVAGDDVWFFGARDRDVSVVEHFDGAGFSAYATLESPVEIARVGARTLAFDVDRGLWERTDAGWVSLLPPVDDDRGDTVFSAVFVDEDDAWLLARTGLERFVGDGFVPQTPQIGFPVQRLANSGVAGDDALWGVGFGSAVLRHD